MTIIDHSLADRVTVEARSSQKREYGIIDVLRALQSIIAFILWGIGWVIAKTVFGTRSAITWCFTAVKIGWIDGVSHGKTD